MPSSTSIEVAPAVIEQAGEVQRTMMSSMPPSDAIARSYSPGSKDAAVLSSYFYKEPPSTKNFRDLNVPGLGNG